MLLKRARASSVIRAPHVLIAMILESGTSAFGHDELDVIQQRVRSSGVPLRDSRVGPNFCSRFARNSPIVRDWEHMLADVRGLRMSAGGRMRKEYDGIVVDRSMYSPDGDLHKAQTVKPSRGMPFT
jgi:hypothetical protein